MENKTNYLENDLSSNFNIIESIEWIKKNDFKRTALQFPDELLPFSPNIYKSIEQHFKDANESRSIFILGDTSYGSCCVDVVAAEHYSADSLIHYGHSCLSEVVKLPVFYVFEKSKVDINEVKSEIETLKNNSNEKIVFVYDVCFYYLINSFKDLSSESIYITDLVLESSNDKSEQSNEFNLFGRKLPAQLKNENERNNFAFFYLGNKENLLNSFQFYFNRSKFYQFSQDTGDNNNKTRCILDYKQLNRKLMKRFYLIERAKDSQIFGILIGTMAVAQYKEAIDHVSMILKKAKKKFYSFLIGKINCPKLNNFLEVDMYVLISCHENTLAFDFKELNKPIISLYELEVAFNSAREWGHEFISDYQQMLNGMGHHIPLEIKEDDSDVSLISGDLRRTAITTQEESEMSLQKREDTLAMIHHSGGGEFLQQRTWKGLEQKLGETQASLVVEGMKGTASSYQTEPI